MAPGLRISALLLAFLISCRSETYVVISVEDPAGAATGTDSIAVGSKPEALSEIRSIPARFPVTFALTVSETTTSSVWVEARVGVKSIARGRAYVDFSTQQGATLSVVLRRFCFDPSECDDGVWCNGKESCEDRMCGSAKPPCEELPLCSVSALCREELDVCDFEPSPEFFDDNPCTTDECGADGKPIHEASADLEGALCTTGAREPGVCTGTVCAISTCGDLIVDSRSEECDAEAACVGCKHETLLVSASSNGAAGNGASRTSALSLSGEVALFTSRASNFDTAVDDKLDLFLHDRKAGTTERITVGLNGGPANGDVVDSVGSLAVSPDGVSLVFASAASNLVPGDRNGVVDVFLKDREGQLTERVSGLPNGEEANGPSYEVDVSSDGKFVAFVSEATNFRADEDALPNVFVRDRTEDTLSRLGSGFGDGRRPSISGSGQLVVWDSSDGGRRVVLVSDVSSGMTEVVSRRPDGGASEGDSWDPDIGLDGTVIAFVSNARDLDPACVDGREHVFTFERASGLIKCATTSACTEPSLSADGRRLVCASAQGVLVIDSTGREISISGAHSPSIDPSGEFVSYSADRTGTPDVFVRALAE
ncbi:MAG: hypothetical protein HY791_26160 [Deltaproteobacteria bacterium]|nr:hypothetical protein [Deltaproteobacteria bacterium]